MADDAASSADSVPQYHAPGKSGKPPSRRQQARLRLRRALPRPVYDGMLLAYNDARARANRGPGRGRILPDYLLIGAAKSGTTTLHAWIADHPFVRAPKSKEIHYFDYEYYRGEDWYRWHFPRAAEREAFARETGRPFLTGEASPTYLSHLWAPERVARALPSVKLLLALRNPIDRAYSQYQMSVREGFETLPFQQAVEREAGRLAPEIARARRDRHYRSEALAKHSYLYRGHYAEQLERWLSFFPRDRFHVVRAEDLAEQPGETLAGVQRFLGLDEHRPALRRLHTASYEGMAPETREWLRGYFRPRNAQLAGLVGFDPGWDG